MNSQMDLNLVISQFEEQGCYNAPGRAAVAAVKWLDEEFILIPRETLPEIKHPALDDAFGGDSTVGTKHLSEVALGGNPEKMREIALEYLVLADFIEGRANTAEAIALKKDQYNAYLTLFPETTLTFDEFNIDSPTIGQSNKNAIARIVDLQRQLAEAQATG